MTGRRDRRAGRYPAKNVYIDPATSFGAAYAWRADDVTAASTVSQWNPYVGGTALSTLVGSAQAAPVAQSTLGGRLGVPHAGTGYYGGTLPNTGTSQTLVFIGRIATDGALCAITNAGAADTGTALLSFAGTTYARRPGFVEVIPAQAVPISGVWIATFTPSSTALYFNSGTPLATNATASAAFNFTQFYLGGDSNTAGALALDGAVCLSAIFNYAMTGAQVASAMRVWCGQYGQVYTP